MHERGPSLDGEAMSVTPEQLAHTLVERHRRQRLAHEQRAGRCREILQQQLAALGGTGCFARAWLIGSLAWGGFGERSDVDVVVEGLAREAVAEVQARRAEALATPVDLLRLEDLPERFGQRVLSEGVLLHGL